MQKVWMPRLEYYELFACLVLEENIACYTHCFPCRCASSSPATRGGFRQGSARKKHLGADLYHYLSVIVMLSLPVFRTSPART
jgi:hypothetical protein